MIDVPKPKPHFYWKVFRNSIFALAAILLSLYIGMWGYHHYENMSWIDAFVNAAMILSGMGPMGELKTYGGKMFAGLYALYSGLFFIGVIALIAAPIVHQFFYRMHIETSRKDL